jgi:hypothetical protein
MPRLEAVHVLVCKYWLAFCVISGARRGHARDLQSAGACLKEILAAGEWRSPAFLRYLDIDALESDLVVDAHMCESSDDEVSP